MVQQYGLCVGSQKGPVEQPGHSSAPGGGGGGGGGGDDAAAELPSALPPARA